LLELYLQSSRRLHGIVLKHVDLHTFTLKSFFPFCGEGPRSRHYGRTAGLRLIVQSCDEDDLLLPYFQVMEHGWIETERGKQKYSGKTSPATTLSTIKSLWTKPGSNPGFCGEKPATNLLSHGTSHIEALTLHMSRIVQALQSSVLV
jgi:hypothetical protein